MFVNGGMELGWGVRERVGEGGCVQERVRASGWMGDRLIKLSEG